MTREPIDLGITTVHYNEEGVPISASFEPTIYHTDTDTVKKELTRANCANEIEAQNNARVVLAAWFARMDSVELADREEGQVEGAVLECKKWPNGKPQLCRLHFYFIYNPPAKS